MDKTGRAALMGIGAVLILLSVLLQSWWARSEGPVSARVGLTKTVLSAPGISKTISLSEGHGGEHDAFITVGQITFWVGLLVFLALVAGAGMTMAGSKDFPMAKLAAAGAAGVEVCAILFFFVLKPEEFGELNMSWGFFACALGAIGGMIGGFAGAPPQRRPVRRRRSAQ